jgi:neutral cholesterol ester hydrolase 1
MADPYLQCCIVLQTGASAGGNLAAAVSLRLRDIGQVPMPSIQILFVPCLQAADFNTPSYQRDRNIAFLPRYWMVNYWLWYALGLNGHQLNDVLVANDHTSSAVKKSVVARLIDHKLIQQKYVDASYVPDSADHGSEAVWNDLEKVFADPYFAPLMDSNLRNVPPAYIVTAEHDVLRDDGILYVRRLLNDGVAVKHRHYDHGFHALLDDFTRFNHAAVVVDDLVEFLAMQL